MNELSNVNPNLTSRKKVVNVIQFPIGKTNIKFTQNVKVDLEIYSFKFYMLLSRVISFLKEECQ